MQILKSDSQVRDCFCQIKLLLSLLPKKYIREILKAPVHKIHKQEQHFFQHNLRLFLKKRKVYITCALFLLHCFHSAKVLSLPSSNLYYNSYGNYCIFHLISYLSLEISSFSLSRQQTQMFHHAIALIWCFKVFTCWKIT